MGLSMPPAVNPEVTEASRGQHRLLGVKEHIKKKWRGQGTIIKHHLWAAGTPRRQE